MKLILLPTDFSKNSINAINYAVELFKNEACEFYVINIQKASSFVSDDLMTMTSSATVYHTLIDVAKKSIKNVIKDLKETYNNDLHKFYSIVDYDNFVDGINQACDTRGIDLIIMGTKGASGAEKVLFGSNTARVMQRCSTPVLAIPDGCKFKGLDKIAFTSNFSIRYISEDLKSLFDISKLYNSSIDILHVTEDELTSNQMDNRAYLDRYFSNLNHEFVNLQESDVFKAIQDYIKDYDIKILAMTSRQHSFLERLFNRHLVEAFAFNIDIPFLVMENSNQ
ncbi:universal stress protein [Flavobacteriaceae bacterium S0825]|uniref:universal stress protein n=1 Tax=Gaetbulibacter sp. S0825 TaxID=2720084 RepID=UPI001431B503|nr:universal stress protein [Gaetbulibacter sp. S0825]MCK0109426.1 universal stress protein [Flavobacteriaceae bacterium S0825]NIX65061.1 universal stress protein [Gaetbulibacter sp. S0825]